MKLTFNFFKLCYNIIYHINRLIIFFRSRDLDSGIKVLRFGYLGKWFPCVCESLNTKGETITLITLLYVLISL
jgi:hypothetical protein